MVKGRFAPSPSGRMHLGNLFSALIAWCSARSVGGQFCLRLDNLDERCRDADNARLICDDLAWMGLDWDADPFMQTEHVSDYECAYSLIRTRAHVYPCFCSRSDLHAASAPHASDGAPIYAGICRNLRIDEVNKKAALRDPAWRLEVPCECISFTDAHFGPIEQDLARECGDFVIRRSDGVFAYQLVVVVDDALQEVSEVVRGSDLLSSTPRQIFLQHLLGLPEPIYRHHPLLRAFDGRRLSKREKDLDMSVLRKRLTPEQLIGWLAYLAGQQQRSEPCSAVELAQTFEWSRVPKEDIVLVV